MRFVNLTKIFMEMKQLYDSKSFDLTSNIDEEMMIEFYVDKDIEVNIPKLTMSLKRYIRFVNEFFITRDDGKIIICIIFRKKKHPIDFGFEFSLN